MCDQSDLSQGHVQLDSTILVLVLLTVHTKCTKRLELLRAHTHMRAHATFVLLSCTERLQVMPPLYYCRALSDCRSVV